MSTVFNPKYKDAPGVLYMSYAGSHEPAHRHRRV